MTTPQSLLQMVNYQEGSVVSKEILSKSTGTVTLFAFDKGQGLSEHTAPYDALALIVDGVASITIDRVQHEVQAGEMLLMPANVTHALKANQPFKMILTMLKS